MQSHRCSANKGLVVLTGCGHAGVINTIRHAQQLTGVENLYAVIGGFHLTGPLFERIIPATVAALKELSPAVIVPAHCTGWKAIHAMRGSCPKRLSPTALGLASCSR